MEQATTSAPVSSDAQAAAPATRVSLSRVGVTGVEKVIRVGHDGDGTEGGGGLYHASLEAFVDLNPEQAGVHMSRFEEVVNEAIDRVVLGESLRAEELAAHIAERVRERQGGIRAEVRISARYPETVPAPVSGIPTQELYTLFGTAVASERGTRTLRGVEAQG
ncbi:MAG: GTP cyclohydrolase, FolE2/MptA family, partial [Solirubrobacterales bacterium]